MEELNEKSTAYITLEFLGDDGLPAVPNTLQYRIDDVHTGAAVKGITTLTPGISVELTLTPDDLTIINQMRQREVKRITVIAGYGVSDYLREELDVAVKNLGFVT